MNKKIVVIGDVILDEYTYGTPLGLSAETPTIVSEQTRVEKYVGGAGLVVRHLLRLGCDVTLLTCDGTHSPSITDAFLDSPDRLTHDEYERLTFRGIPVPNFKVTQKRRFFSGDYKIAQFDIRNHAKHTARTRNVLADMIKEKTRNADLFLVSDYRHGVIDHELAVVFKRSKIPVWVDSQVSQEGSNHDWYTNMDKGFINEREAAAIDLKLKRPNAHRDLFQNLVLKLGASGAMTFTRGEVTGMVSRYPVETVDTCGAGDAFFAAMAAFNDLQFANYWAALSTTYKGTVVPEAKYLRMENGKPIVP